MTLKIHAGYAITVIAVLLIGPVSGDENAVPGLIGFDITDLGRDGNQYHIKVDYDATLAGNPWEGGIYGYGEIDRLRRMTISMYAYRNRTKADTFVLVADNTYPDGYSSADPIYWIQRISKNEYGVDLSPDPGISGDGKSGNLPEDTPLVGNMEANMSLRGLPTGETIYVVFWACIEYEGFSEYMYNIDYVGPVRVEYATDVNLMVSGPDYIVPEDQVAVFNLSVSGGNTEDVVRVDWVVEYRSGANWTALPSIYGFLGSGLTLDGNRLWNYFKLLEEHGEGGELDMRVTALAYRAYQGLDLMATSNVHAFTLGPERKIRGRVLVLPPGFPLVHTRIVFRNDELTVDTSTDSNGRFEIPPEMLDGGEYDLEIDLQYLIGDKPCFTVYYDWMTRPIRISIKLRGDAIESFRFRTWHDEIIPVGPGESITPVLDFEKYLGGRAQDDFIYTYVHLTEALEFYTEVLGVSFDCDPPLEVRVGTNGLKWPLKFIPNTEREGLTVHGITIPFFEMQSSHPYRPKNREYHEFSHFAMFEVYGGFPEPPPGAMEEINHHGFVNPTTADSYVEGFAHFMAMVIAEYYDFWWNQEDYPANSGYYGDLEYNFKPWLRLGIAEELAIAGILWDLYDGQEQYEKSSRTVELLTDRYEEWLDLHDENGDGQLEGDEVLTLKACMMVEENFKHECSKTIVEKFLTYDADGNKLLDLEELRTLLDSSYDDPPDPGLKMDLYDEDGDERIDEVELLFILAGSTHEEISGDLPERYTLDTMIGEISSREDDGVDLTMEELWEVIGVYHADFTSVYESLTAKFPQIGQEIDEVFISHDFFADRDVGNGVHDPVEPFRDENGNGAWEEGEYFTDTAWPGISHDPGEHVGNATNYQRPGRRSLPSLPGQFIRVDNEVPYYEVGVDLYEQDSGARGLPLWHYEVRVANADGMVFLPVPPDPYDAILTVVPEGTTANNPLIFSSGDFNRDYAGTLERGYFLEHEFEITGEIPVLPPYPGEEVPETIALAVLALVLSPLMGMIWPPQSRR